jgi:hypothetical protein
MFKKPQRQPAQPHAKRIYRAPRLTDFGKLHAIVAGGASGDPEGMMSMDMKKRG